MKTNITTNKAVYYLDHHGKPQISICNGEHSQGSWKMYSIAGLANLKFENEVFATKEDLLEFIENELSKLK